VAGFDGTAAADVTAPAPSRREIAAAGWRAPPISSSSQRGSQTTVIAGYHWFGDWGRDTMIALPGLTLATGRYDAAKSILLAFAGYVDRGMLPNRFPDAGETPEYNTVDATLWFFEAVRALAARTGTTISCAPISMPCSPISSPGTSGAPATASTWIRWPAACRRTRRGS
jgi:hypothetical protein